MPRTYPSKRQIDKDLQDLSKIVVDPVLQRIRDYILNLEDKIKELENDSISEIETITNMLNKARAMRDAHHPLIGNISLLRKSYNQVCDRLDVLESHLSESNKNMESKDAK